MCEGCNTVAVAVVEAAVLVANPSTNYCTEMIMMMVVVGTWVGADNLMATMWHSWDRLVRMVWLPLESGWQQQESKIFCI